MHDWKGDTHGSQSTGVGMINRTEELRSEEQLNRILKRIDERDGHAPITLVVPSSSGFKMTTIALMVAILGGLFYLGNAGNADRQRLRDRLEEQAAALESSEQRLREQVASHQAVLNDVASEHRQAIRELQASIANRSTQVDKLVEDVGYCKAHMVGVEATLGRILTGQNKLLDGK